MCGRFTLDEPQEDLVERFAVTEVEPAVEVRPSWNIAPTQSIVAVTSDKEGVTRRLSSLRWGLVPWWAKDPAIGNRMVNARAETLAESRAYRSAFEKRRCLIPASGFYEWQKLDRSGGKRARSQPYYAQPADGSVLALAGLWESWHGDEDGDVLRTCTIITTGPNAALSAIHDRMPVILASDSWSRWLHPSPLDEEERTGLLVPAPEGLLVVSPVGEGVNKARNDGPELVEPVVPAETPLPFPE